MGEPYKVHYNRKGIHFKILLQEVVHNASMVHVSNGLKDMSCRDREIHRFHFKWVFQIDDGKIDLCCLIIVEYSRPCSE